MPRRILDSLLQPLRILTAVLAVAAWVAPEVSRRNVLAQEGDESRPAEARTGLLIDVPLPITSAGVDRISRQLASVSERGGRGAAGRLPIVLDFRTDESDGSATEFEDALRLARTLAKPEFRQLRFTAYVAGDVRGHAVLPVLACDSLAVGPDASIGDASIRERGEDADETVIAAYRTVAARRALISPTVAEALVRPSLELVEAIRLDGTRQFATGEELEEMRRAGGGWKEEVWAAAGQSLVIRSSRLRDSRIASHVVASRERLASALELSELRPVDRAEVGGESIGALLEVNGVISTDRVRRWEMNLVHSVEKAGAEFWMTSIESPGGSVAGSVQLAGTLSTVEPPIRRTIGYVSRKALADSSIIALACRPLYLHPDARIGGPGAINPDPREIADLEEAIRRIAQDSGRPAALLQGLLDPSMTVYRYTNRRTGEVRYATPEDVPEAEDDGGRGTWQRGPAIPLREGLTATQAIELGLAEGKAASLDEAASLAGLPAAPPPLAPRGIVHFVEWFGSLTGVSVILLLVGLLTLSIEIGAPGLSISGFISMICFTLYFWIQFLSGTAEWLEILAFVLGVVCIMIEVFVVPGVGIFGIGGLCLLVLGVVLTSQTFVIPRNAYQYELLTRNLWLVLAGMGAVMLGLALLKFLLPQTRLMRDLALIGPDEATLDQSERLVNFDHLLDSEGVAATPLMPAGRARFGDELVQVITDGSPVAVGEPIRVIAVHGNRVVVAPLD